jgi:hypothetical protein
MFTQFDHDASRDGLLQKDGGRLTHGSEQSSLLQDKRESGCASSGTLAEVAVVYPGFRAF